MKKSISPLTLCVAFLFVSCVTINIYFPAAAAQKAADRIIQDVWSATGGQAPLSELQSGQTDEPQTEQSADPSSAETQTQSALGVLSDLLVPAAHAQANLNVSTPAINKIRSSMKNRHPQLAPHYASGAIGLTNRALIAQRDASRIPLKDRNTVKQLVSAENADRNALYREIAKANGHPEWEANIRNTFASRWVANASQGWWHQDSTGGWRQR